MMTELRGAKSPSKLIGGAIAALALSLAGCAGGYSANTVSSSQVGYAKPVRTGVITAVREITIKPDNSIIGSAAGALLGGLAGSELGGGQKAQTAGAIGGAVLGGVAGNAACQALNTRKGLAYTIRFDNGSVEEIDQGNDFMIQPGTPVEVVYSGGKAIVKPQGGYYPGGY